MNIKINAELTGQEIVKYFADLLKSKNVNVVWKEGSELPVNTKIFVFSDKAGKDVEIAPDKLKIVFDE